jgi:hypothetical protein
MWVFKRLGTRPELRKTLVQFTEVGADPPAWPPR